MQDKAIIRRLSFLGIFGNILLSAFKLLAGILGHSGAMVSDAVHSLSDVFATFIAWLGTRIAGKAPDESHPYGHDRFECLASMLLGGILAITGVSIGWAGVQSVLTGSYRTAAAPTLLPLIAAVISILVKEGMFRYTLHYAKVLNSDVFRADAWHHRSDALSSVGSLAGIGASLLGFPVMDPVASVIICLFILKVAYDILRDAVSKLLDTACTPAYEERLRAFILSDPEVLAIDLLRTRMFSSSVYADVEISVDNTLSLVEAHTIAERVHHGIEQHFPEIKHVMVHVNPGDAE